MPVTIIKEEDFRRAKTIFKVEIDSMDIKDWEIARELLYGQLIDENNKYRKCIEIIKNRFGCKNIDAYEFVEELMKGE